MKPESTSVILRRDLSAAAQEYDSARAQTFFIGRRVAPIFPVAEPSATYPIFNRESLRKPANTDRRSAGGYNRVTGLFGSGSYQCVEHGLEYPLDDAFVRRYASYFDSEQAATRILRHQLLTGYERRVADLTLNSSGVFTARSPATVWSTSATAVPLTDLITGCNTLEDNCGIPRANFTLIMPRADKAEMVACAQVVDKVKYTYPGVQPAELQARQIAAMLEIKQVLICGGAYDAANEGIAESLTQIWTAGKVLLCVLAEDGEPLETPSLARTLLWTADAPELPVVESYRDETVRGDVIRMRDHTDEVITCVADLFGYLLST